MKFILFSLVSFFAVSSMASEFTSRTRFACVLDDDRKYELELVINDVGDQEGTVVLLNKKTNKAVRTAKASYKNSEFFFGKDQKETAFIESVDSVGVDEDGHPFANEAVTGYVYMNEVSANIYCQEIAY